MGKLSPAGCLAVATSIVLLLSTPLNLFALEGTTWTTTGSLSVRDKWVLPRYCGHIKKADNGQGGVSWEQERSTQRSSRKRQ